MKRGKHSVGSGQTISVGGLVILSLIQEAPRSGYDLVKEFERQAVSDWAQISKAQVYQLLRQLEAKDYARAANPQGARKRSVYEITESGSQVLREELFAPAWLNDLAPSNFMTWLGLAVHAPEGSVYETMVRRRDWLVAQIASKTNVLDFVSAYPSVRAEFGVRLIHLYLAHLRAELEWIEIELEGFSS